METKANSKFSFKNIFWGLLLIASVMILFLRLFYRLDILNITDTDEAWHLGNAYDMLKNNNWMINTYMGETDYYNSKPPLALDFMILFLKTLGVSITVAKLSAAVAGFIAISILLIFVAKTYGIITAAISAAGMLTLNIVYDYHGFRSANLDAMFVLTWAGIIITLELSKKKNVYLIGTGIFLALAFLTKSFHIISFLPVCLVGWLCAEKKHRLKNTFLAVVAGICTILPWAIKRYMFDSFKFFNTMLFGEVKSKVTIASDETSTHFSYTRDIVTQPAFIILCIVMLCYIISNLVKAKEIAKAFNKIKEDFKTDVNIWSGFIIPVLFYSCTKSHHEWYVYPSMILMPVLVGIYTYRASLNFSFIKFGGIIIAAYCFIQAVIAISSYPDSIDGGGPADEFRADLQRITQTYGEEYKGSNIYIQNTSRLDPDKELDFFHDELRAYAMYEGEMTCISGGIDKWLQDKDGILILNKDLWDEYSDVLIGYVILQDNGYLWFLPETY